MPKPLPHVDDLRECLSYDPDSGVVTWLLPSETSRVRHGDQFGSKTSVNGSNSTKHYFAGMFRGTTYYVHRIIWMYMTEEDPGDLMVDHINGNGMDNRWKNLRLVSRAANIQNQKGHKRRRSPYKHVYKQGKNWIGQVRRNKVLHSTKRFQTAEEAYKAVVELITRLDNLS
jgi:hypothetical protein